MSLSVYPRASRAAGPCEGSFCLTECRSFTGQAPVFLVAIILCWIALPNSNPKQRRPGQESDADEPKTSKLRRVDFLGSILLAGFLILILLPLEIGGTKIAWTDPRIAALFASGLVCLALFVVAEKRWVTNPLLPLSLFASRHTVVSFVILALQTLAQLGVRTGSVLPVYHTQQTLTMPVDDVLGPALLPGHAEDEQHRRRGPSPAGGHR